nr:MAG TPA: hypothetical protein [Caudoviricetes sp.]
MIDVTKLPEYIKTLLTDKDKVFIGDLPSLSEEGVGILLEEGSSDSRYFGQYRSLARPYIRITIRSKKYVPGMERAESIKKDLDKYTDENILQCLIAGSPMYIGKNEQKLHEIQLLFYITLKE